MAEQVVLTGRGVALPDGVLHNDDVAALADPARLRAFVDGNVWCRQRFDALRGNGAATLPVARLDQRVFAEFVRERVGIRERRVIDRDAVLARRASSAGTGADLGAAAARRALAAAGRRPDDVDVVLLGSSTPDSLCPAGAVIIQAGVGARRAWAFDVQAACSSFVFALATARGLVASGQARCVLVVAAEFFSAMTDWAEPATSYFAGDGAAAVVVEAASSADARPGPRFELVDTVCRSSLSENIHTGVGGTRLLQAWTAPDAAAAARPGDDGYRYFHQNGPLVYRDVLPSVEAATHDLLASHGLGPADVARWWVHQASLPMIDGIFGRLLGARPPPSVAPIVLETLGNTSACGAAYCLAEDPGLEPGQHGVVLVFGGGYTIGVALLRGSS